MAGKGNTFNLVIINLSYICHLQDDLGTHNPLVTVNSDIHDELASFDNATYTEKK